MFTLVSLVLKVHEMIQRGPHRCYVQSKPVLQWRNSKSFWKTNKQTNKQTNKTLVFFLFYLGLVLGFPGGTQFRLLVVSNLLWPHGQQCARLPCPSPMPRACSNSCPPSQWCHPAMSSSVIPFSSRRQSFPASGSFPMNQFFASGDQSIGVSASISVLPMNNQDLFPLGLTDLILQAKGVSRVFSNTTVQKHQFFSAQLSLQSNSHIHTWLLEKPGGASGEKSAYQCTRHRGCKRNKFDPWVRKIPWRRKWQPTPVFLLGEPHGQRSMGYSPWAAKSWTWLSDLYVMVTLQCCVSYCCSRKWIS